MRKLIGNVKTQNLEKMPFFCGCLNLLSFKYWATINELIMFLNLVSLIISIALLFRTKKQGTSYIPSQQDFLTIQKSFFFWNKIYTFTLEIKNLYNTLEKWRFRCAILSYTALIIVSLVTILGFILKSFH